MLRILFIHNDYGRYSGEEAACDALEELLSEHGHQVSWYRRSSARIGDSLVSHVKAFCAGIHSRRSRREVAALLDERAPDLVHVQNLYPFISPSVFRPCRARGIPVVMRCPNYRLFCPGGLHLHRGTVCERCLGAGHELWCILQDCQGSLPKSVGYAIRNAVARLTRSVLRGADIFIVLSEFQKAKFAAHGIPADRLEILPNIARLPEAELAAAQGSTVSFLGRIAEEKGFDEFVAAARALPDIPFAAAGDVKAAQQHLVTALPPNLAWHGFLRGPELTTFVRNTRIFVSPSRWFEGFPNTVATMMSYGKPVVAARIGALPEIVEENRTGLLYAPGQTRELADSIDQLWSDPQRCSDLGATGQDKALREYSPDAVYDRLMEIYAKAQALATQRTNRPAD